MAAIRLNCSMLENFIVSAFCFPFVTLVSYVADNQ